MPGFTFRRVRRSDFPLLQRWLAEAHVSKWWNHEFSPEAIERDFGPGVDGAEPGEDYLVFMGGVAIGLIQFSRFEDYPDYVEEVEGVLPVPAGAVSIDYLIGDASLIGRGLGRAMLMAFVERIWVEQPTATCILVRSTPPTSRRGRRCWQPGSISPAVVRWNRTTWSTIGCMRSFVSTDHG
jgi:aminoglycoside 6'-N-acetyltransferase